jgi:glycosyltransferase involved in cell wall biosynthesis
VIGDYGIDPAKVHVVVPGANLDPEIYAAWAAERGAPAIAERETLRLVFVGRDPQRKGLDRLIRALTIAQSRGADCTLSVIGATPDMVANDLRQAPSVKWLGLIDKRLEARRFLDTVSRHDVGCLLSRAEAGGIGLREYHALGLAVMGPRTGGAPDHMVSEGAIMVEPESDDASVADAIVRLWRNRNEVERLKAASWMRRDELTWKHAAEQLGRITAK